MKKMSPDLEQARDDLLRKAFNVVAHDFKTPLAVIIGSLDIIESMKASLSPEQIDTLINSALAEAHRLDKMISKTLESAKP